MINQLWIISSQSEHGRRKQSDNGWATGKHKKINLRLTMLQLFYQKTGWAITHPAHTAPTPIPCDIWGPLE